MNGIKVEMEYAEFIRLAQRIMARLSWEQRLRLIDDICEGYCRHCGQDDPEGTCQCWNDE